MPLTVFWGVKDQQWRFAEFSLCSRTTCLGLHKLLKVIGFASFNGWANKTQRDEIDGPMSCISLDQTVTLRRVLFIAQWSTDRHGPRLTLWALIFPLGLRLEAQASLHPRTLVDAYYHPAMLKLPHLLVSLANWFIHQCYNLTACPFLPVSSCFHSVTLWYPQRGPVLRLPRLCVHESLNKGMALG